MGMGILFNQRLCFNPTMVRLLLAAAAFSSSLSVFQSHNGAIAAKAKFGVLGAE